MTLSAISPAISPEREASLLASVPTGLLIGGQWRDHERYAITADEPAQPDAA